MKKSLKTLIIAEVGEYQNGKLDLAKKLFEFDVEVNLNEINRTN